ncbi:MAG TPA: nitrite reductase (NAD(P)H) small subunit [Ignavibacteriaceae bacterium]|nr:nitrite reductase (NAD(P)H) small subunit [Ignavibacteriaceae bacterium]
MIDDSFTKLCKFSDLTDRQGKRFIIDDTEVALFKVDNEIYALSNICPHQHTALIYDGFIEDDCVVCPAHGWMFDLKTGKLRTGSSRLTTYPVIIQDDNIFVKVSKRDLNW